MIVVIGILSLLFLYLAWRKLDWAVLALIFLLPTYLLRFSLGLPFTFLEVMIGSVFVVWVIQNWKFLGQRLRTRLQGQKLSAQNRYPFQWPLIAWLFVSLGAVGVAGFSWAALGIWRAYFFEPALLFIVAVNVLQTRKQILQAITALGLSTLVVAVFAIYQYATGSFIANEFWAAAATRRATSFFPYPNAVGLYVAPIIMMVVGAVSYVFVSNKKAEHIGKISLYAVVIMLGVAALVCARSEGAMLATGAGLLVFGILAHQTLRKITVAVIVLAVVALYMSVPLRTYLVDRLTLKNFSGQVRQQQWKETWQMLQDGRLVLGSGLANYQSSVAPYHQEGIFVKDYSDPDFQRKLVYNPQYRDSHWQPLEIYLYPHNILLNFWTELGLAGVLVFLWILVTFVVYSWQTYRVARRHNDPIQYIVLGLGLSVVVMIIHGLVDVPYFKNDLSALFWLTMAMTGVLWLQRQTIIEKA